MREFFWLPIRLLMNLPFIPLWVLQLPFELFWNFLPNAYVVLWIGIFGLANLAVAAVVVPTYVLFVLAVLVFLIVGGVFFPFLALVFIIALFIWGFYELGVYIDDLLNEKDYDLGV